MKVKGTGSGCLLEECVKDNYYASFHTHSYHCCKKINFISRLDVNFLDSTPNFDKGGPRGRVVKAADYIISLNHFIISPLWLVWVRSPQGLHVGQVKFYLRVCQGGYTRGTLVSRPTYWLARLNMSEIILKGTLNWIKKKKKIDKVSWAWNEGQGHQVMMPAWRVCQGQLLCKVSSSQLPLLQRNKLYF